MTPGEARLHTKEGPKPLVSAFAGQRARVRAGSPASPGPMWSLKVRVCPVALTLKSQDPLGKTPGSSFRGFQNGCRGWI
ncbi:hypothetical protein AW736_12140 [Termitidicoccus mucosus]|uniref:Uncharacterized protein n=1 Tax=Termitidicoccus mucosus TaxID=1184151 RepID=A0A178II67_9BACT|nr:hypothetical protein AW736_12140 [Opitutaceae bacterium TSB47]